MEGFQEVPMEESRAASDGRITVSIRLPAEVHKAAAIAAARAGKSLNVWLADLAEAASSVSNATALLVQIQEMKLADDQAKEEVVKRFVSLVETSLDFTGRHLSELGDVVTKMCDHLQSMAQAEEIRRAKKRA